MEKLLHSHRKDVTDLEVDEIYKTLTAMSGKMNGANSARVLMRHPLLHKYEFHAVDFIRGAHHAVRMIFHNANSSQYRNFLNG
jgi:hypothetical protein